MEMSCGEAELGKVKLEPMDDDFVAGDYVGHVKLEPKDVSTSYNQMTLFYNFHQDYDFHGIDIN